MPPSREKALESVSKAKTFLKEGEDNLSDGRLNSAVVMAYLALFDAEKALLYKEGWREKSHACVVSYLREKHEEIPKKVMDSLEYYKNIRHSVQYELEFFFSEKDAEEMIVFAKDFIKLVEKLV